MRRTKIQRTLIAAMAVLLLTVSVFPSTASAADPTTWMNKLKETFATGKYWNHTSSATAWHTSVTSNPCAHHAAGCAFNGSCGCNSYGSAIQCHGFGKFMASRVYASSPNIQTKVYANGTSVGNNWTVYTAAGVNYTLKPGDVIRDSKNEHTAIVWKVTGNTVEVAEVLGGLGCEIHWGGFNKNDANKDMYTLTHNLLYVARYEEPYK